jgi:hypothetical protein
MRGWLESLKVYGDRPVLVVLLLGFASGLPLALTGATLTFWMAEAGADIKVIGFFAWVGIAYGWKFLWSPALDRLPLPVLTRLLGRRRGWLVLIQALLIASILALGCADPAVDLRLTAFCAVVVAFLSASQDIVIDAYRVEILEERQQGAGAAAVTFGYRMAMFVSGAGALILAEFYGWFAAYAAMAALLLVGHGHGPALRRARGLGRGRGADPARPAGLDQPSGCRALRRLLRPQRRGHGAAHPPLHHPLQGGRRAPGRGDEPVLRGDGLRQDRGGGGREDLRARRHAGRRDRRGGRRARRGPAAGPVDLRHRPDALEPWSTSRRSRPVTT